MSKEKTNEELWELHNSGNHQHCWLSCEEKRKTVFVPHHGLAVEEPTAPIENAPIKKFAERYETIRLNVPGCDYPLLIIRERSKLFDEPYGMPKISFTTDWLLRKINDARPPAPPQQSPEVEPAKRAAYELVERLRLLRR